MQFWTLGHTLPQAPQLFRSILTGVHAPLQQLWPPGQHKPLQQTPFPPLQALKHAPQLFGSDWVETHCPPQQV
jgi:hypothetical protein